MCFGLKYLHCCTYVLEKRAKAVALFLQYAAPQQQGLGFSFFTAGLASLAERPAFCFALFRFGRRGGFVLFMCETRERKEREGMGGEALPFFCCCPFVCSVWETGDCIACNPSDPHPPPLHSLLTQSLLTCQKTRSRSLRRSCVPRTMRPGLQGQQSVLCCAPWTLEVSLRLLTDCCIY